MKRPIDISLPTGEIRSIPAPAGSDDKPLSLWLGENGIQLNTRCGGKGICSGCLVRINDDPRPVRACATHTHELHPDSTVRIPARSYSDGTLHGITEFTILASTDNLIPGQGLGIAIDVGTTTVAIAIWNLQTGQCLGSKVRANQQIRYGDNLIARVEYSLASPDGIDHLKKALWIDTLKPLIAELCVEHGVDKQDIRSGVVAANPVMLHTLTGDSLAGFSMYPFHAAFLGERTIVATRGDSGLADIPLRLMPGMGPFVGADITAGVIAAAVPQTPANALLIDFGTNGEIFLKANGRYFATATAAGPAFEGGHLCCGSTARSGVISSIGRTNGQWTHTLIGGGGEPVGISGAAYIDWIAHAYACGIVNEMGRFVSDHPGIAQFTANNRIHRGFRLSGDLFISEADIAEILKAKAAISAGVMTLLECAGISPAEIGKLFVAGGFGYHMNASNARVLGLLPPIESQRIEVIGNASLGGASYQLLHPRAADSCKEFLNEVTVIELNQQKCFEAYFTDSLSIGNDFD